MAGDPKFPSIDRSYTIAEALSRLEVSLKDKLEENMRIEEGGAFRVFGIIYKPMELPDKPGRIFRPLVILENGRPSKITIEDYTENKTAYLNWDELSLSDKEAVLNEIETRGGFK